MTTPRRSILVNVIVLAVIVVLLTAVVVRFARDIRLAHSKTSCINNCRQIGLAMIQYAGDHDDAFPPLVDADGNKAPAVNARGEISQLPSRTAFAVLMKEGYLTTCKVFVCPTSEARWWGDSQVGRDFPSDYGNARLQDLILPEKNCSYGWDPTKKHSADAACAIVADNPPRDVSAANEGTPRNNSDNHGKEGQMVFYNSGHVTWGATPRPDSGSDPDIYTGGPGYEKSLTDAKIIR